MNPQLIEAPIGMHTRTKHSAAARSRSAGWYALPLVGMFVGCHLFLGYDEDGAGPSGGAGGTAGAANIGGGGTDAATTSTGGMGAMANVGGSGGTGGPSPCTDLGEAQFAATPAVGVDEDFSQLTSVVANWGARYFTMNGAGFDNTACSVRLCPNQLRIYPGKPDGAAAGYFWYDEQTAPMVFQRVTGDFAIEVDVTSEPIAQDTDIYTGAGIIIRNPDALLHWVTYRVGRGGQDAGLGTDVRWHSPTSGPRQTQLLSSATRAGRLLVCRIAGTFSFHRWLTGEALPSTEAATSVSDAAMGSVDTVEVGLTATWYENNGQGAVGIFENVEFHEPPSSHTACADLL